jgi:hypothetical protein
MPEVWFGADAQSLIVAAAFALVFFVVIFVDRRWPMIKRSRRWRHSPSPAQVPAAQDTRSPPIDASAQLRAVMNAPFERTRVMNVSEYAVFKIIESELAAAKGGYRLFAKTSLGEILRSPNDEAFRSINSKRVDMLIVDAQGWPALAIEYNGSGHYQNDAAARDAVKKEALRKAGVLSLIVEERDSEALIRARLRETLSLRPREGSLRSGPPSPSPSGPPSGEARPSPVSSLAMAVPAAGPPVGGPGRTRTCNQTVMSGRL